MPEFMWWAFIAWGTLGVLATIWIIARRGGTVRLGGLTTVVNGRVIPTGTPSHKAVDNVGKRIGALHQLLYRRYLALVIKAGGNPSYVTEYDDVRFYSETIRNALMGGNSQRTVQKMIESEIDAGSYVGKDPKEFARAVLWPESIRIIKSVLNDRYDTSVRQRDDTMRERIVPNKDVCDDLDSPKTGEDAIAEVSKLIEFAQECTQHGCKDSA